MGKRLTRPRIERWYIDTAKDLDRVKKRRRELREYLNVSKGGRLTKLQLISGDLRDLMEEYELVLASLRVLAYSEGAEVKR